tara:strand:- start:7211 stop:9001 length:1791 start_codon:yes stop_codon:yes gene_type:complete
MKNDTWRVEGKIVFVYDEKDLNDSLEHDYFSDGYIRKYPMSKFKTQEEVVEEEIKNFQNKFPDRVVVKDETIDHLYIDKINTENDKIYQENKFRREMIYAERDGDIGSYMATGGITKGKSHAEGGIPMEVSSTGQKVELEGGEGVINKKNMSDKTLHDYEGKKLTKCEIASEINSDGGNGVQIDCDGIVGKKYKHEEGGKVSKMKYNSLGNVFPDLTQNQRQDIMESYMGQYEHGGNISNCIEEHKRTKSLNKKIRKQSMELGGVTKNEFTPIQVVFDRGIKVDIMRGDNLDSQMNLHPNKLYNLLFHSIRDEINESGNRTNSVRFYLKDKARGSFGTSLKYFFDVDRHLFNVSSDVSDIKNDSGLTFEDKERLFLLSSVSAKDMTIDQISFLAEFKGKNAANSLSTIAIQKLFSLIFEHKSSSISIGRIAIYNNGVGNISSLAPKDCHVFIKDNNEMFVRSDLNKSIKTEVNYDEVESDINALQNYSSDDQNWSYFNDIETLNADAIMLVYPTVNPRTPLLPSYLWKNGFNGVKSSIGISIAEFSSREIMSKFKNTQKDFLNGERNIVYQEINTGITKDGNFCLISIFKNEYFIL